MAAGRTSKASTSSPNAVLKIATRSINQCKRVEKYDDADTRGAVDLFLKGKFKDTSCRLVLCCTQPTLDFAGVGVVQQGGPQSRVESVSLNDAYYELKFQCESPHKEKPVCLLPEDLFPKPQRRQLARGRGGSGKTTWLRRTFNRLVEDTRYFPLLIERRQLARTWQSGKSSLETYLRQWLKDYEVGNRDDILKHLFKNAEAPSPCSSWTAGTNSVDSAPTSEPVSWDCSTSAAALSIWTF